MRCDALVGALLWWSCQSPVAHRFGFLNHLNSFCGGLLKHNTKVDAELLLYSLTHFEYDGHTIYMLTQWHPLPPLTSTVKTLFTHVHSSPPSLDARLHWCYANHYYINNDWTFSRQTSYILYYTYLHVPVCVCVYVHSVCVCVCVYIYIYINKHLLYPVICWRTDSLV